VIEWMILHPTAVSSGPLEPGEVAEKASQTFQAALSKIKPMASYLTSCRIVQVPGADPGGVRVKITASAGAVLASAGEGHTR